LQDDCAASDGASRRTRWAAIAAPCSAVADAAGLTTARYRNGDVDDMKRSVRTACIEIKERIALEGVFQDRLAE